METLSKQIVVFQNMFFENMHASATQSMQKSRKNYLFMFKWNSQQAKCTFSKNIFLKTRRLRCHKKQKIMKNLDYFQQFSGVLHLGFMLFLFFISTSRSPGKEFCMTTLKIYKMLRFLMTVINAGYHLCCVFHKKYNIYEGIATL